MPAAGSSSSRSLGFRCGRTGDLEPAAVRVGKAVRGLPPAVADQPIAEERKPLLGQLLDLTLLAPHARRAQNRTQDARFRVAVGRGHHVLLHCHVQEQAQRLERARNPSACDLVGIETEKRLTLEQDLAFLRRVDPGDHVEERRLAGAVRADDADDLAFADDEVEPVEAPEPTEGERDALYLEQRRSLFH